MGRDNIMRGAFIVLEGCDKSGKSTQCLKLVDKLLELGFKAQKIQFPDRSTVTGGVLNSYLTNKVELSDQAVHLLFAANRWESEQKIRKLLHEGITLVADRYSFSGVAYTSAKPGLDFEWCRLPETGLPKPDLVVLLGFLSDSVERSGFGEERYENKEFQERVYRNYLKMKDETWKVVEGGKSIDETHKEILKHATEVLKHVETSELKSLW